MLSTLPYAVSIVYENGKFIQQNASSVAYWGYQCAWAGVGEHVGSGDGVDKVSGTGSSANGTASSTNGTENSMGRVGDGGTSNSGSGAGGAGAGGGLLQKNPGINIWRVLFQEYPDCKAKVEEVKSRCEHGNTWCFRQRMPRITQYQQLGIKRTKQVSTIRVGRGGDDGCQGSNTVWHDVTISWLRDVVTNEDTYVITQDDITKTVENEQQSKFMKETEKQLLEELLPPHITSTLLQDTTSSYTSSDLPSTTSNGSSTTTARAMRESAPNLQPSISGLNLGVLSDVAFESMARYHEQVTLLQCDIKGFTNMCQQVHPAAVMKLLNTLYTRFDELLEPYGVFKVGTIGDAYMVASGLFDANFQHQNTTQPNPLSTETPLSTKKPLQIEKTLYGKPPLSTENPLQREVSNFTSHQLQHYTTPLVTTSAPQSQQIPSDKPVQSGPPVNRQISQTGTEDSVGIATQSSGAATAIEHTAYRSAHLDTQSSASNSVALDTQSSSCYTHHALRAWSYPETEGSTVGVGPSQSPSQPSSANPCTHSHAADRMIQFAQALLAACEGVEMPGGEHVQVRVGVHSGPVMSGVVGSRMPRFCLFGETVLKLGYVESAGEVMCVNASEETVKLVGGGEEWERVGDGRPFVLRGKWRGGGRDNPLF